MVTHVTAGPRSAVAAFSQRVFAELPRADQRRWAHAFLVSVLATPGKKSVRRLAATVSDSPTAFLSLHQFINASPWAWAPVRAELARWTVHRMGPRAYVVDRAVLLKRGPHSCGAHSSFVASAGRHAICQVGLGGFLATAGEAVPVDWRLLLPGPWGSDPAHRLRARIPDDVPGSSVEQLVLDLADSQVRATGLSTLPVVADLPDDIDTAAVARGLDLCGRGFLLAVPGTVREPHHAGGAHRTHRVLALPHERGSSRWWLTNLTHARADRLLALAQLTVRARHSLEELESGFGLADFGGRSYPGWHHHMTMTSAAYAYGRLGGEWDLPDLIPA
ncbi:IS701 family transposase [Streptomyces flavofungini]|uniref:IS701 family transposase n=1 Tax=Streptomyces flavofungini TaxID=68200 RepID=UPI0025AF5D40|nr:transposase [Streptomyces flavofungini]WJV47453.1 transposase [Streptomyces flavofungini]